MSSPMANYMRDWRKRRKSLGLPTHVAAPAGSPRIKTKRLPPIGKKQPKETQAEISARAAVNRAARAAARAAAREAASIAQVMTFTDWKNEYRLWAADLRESGFYTGPDFAIWLP